jgi:hypothetical protein
MMVICPGWLIMVPVYLLATRGVRGLSAVAKAAAFFALLCAVSAITAFAVTLLRVLFTGVPE